jgi:short-subunit dehydrogenase
MTEALFEELKPFRIKVTAVMPGSFRTRFLADAAQLRTEADWPYAASAGAAMNHFAAIAGKQPGDPKRGADAILKAVMEEQPPLYVLLGADAVRRTRARADALAHDIERWEELSRCTGFPENQHG